MPGRPLPAPEQSTSLTDAAAVRQAPRQVPQLPAQDVPVDVAPGEPLDVGDLPIAVAAAGGDVPQEVDVAVAAPQDAAQLSDAGIVFSLSEADPAVDDVAVQVEVDYSAAAQVLGAGWAGRAQLVRYPACVLDSPQDPACATGQVVATDNDVVAQTLTVDGLEVAGDPGVPATAPDVPAAADPPAGGPDGSGPSSPSDAVQGEPADSPPAATQTATTAAHGIAVRPGWMYAAASTTDSGSVYAVSSSSSGGSGSYAAAPLNPAGSWDVGGVGGLLLVAAAARSGQPRRGRPGPEPGLLLAVGGRPHRR